MEETIREGGDTDTNACIVGGMIGAYYGLGGLPSEWVEKIRMCRAVKKRDVKYQARVLLEEKLVEKLLKKVVDPEQLSQCALYG